MTLTLNLSPELEQFLSQQAKQHGLTVEAFALQLLTDSIARKQSGDNSQSIEDQTDAASVHESALDPQERGRKMAEFLSQLAATSELGDIDPMLWQQEIRQDRPLPGR